jgi:hypothetical protein
VQHPRVDKIAIFKRFVAIVNCSHEMGKDKWEFTMKPPGRKICIGADIILAIGPFQLGDLAFSVNIPRRVKTGLVTHLMSPKTG